VALIKEDLMLSLACIGVFIGLLFALRLKPWRHWRWGGLLAGRSMNRAAARRAIANIEVALWGSAPHTKRELDEAGVGGAARGAARAQQQSSDVGSPAKSSAKIAVDREEGTAAVSPAPRVTRRRPRHSGRRWRYFSEGLIRPDKRPSRTKRPVR
jgi:hypothetical protein